MLIILFVAGNAVSYDVIDTGLICRDSILTIFSPVLF